MHLTRFCLPPTPPAATRATRSTPSPPSRCCRSPAGATAGGRIHLQTRPTHPTKPCTRTRNHASVSNGARRTLQTRTAPTAPPPTQPESRRPLPNTHLLVAGPQSLLHCRRLGPVGPRLAPRVQLGGRAAGDAPTVPAAAEEGLCRAGAGGERERGVRPQPAWGRSYVRHSSSTCEFCCPGAAWQARPRMSAWSQSQHCGCECKGGGGRWGDRPATHRELRRLLIC